MPADLASSLSTNTPPVQVSFDQVAAAADAGTLRVAVVDSRTRWVAATDASRNVVAARAPEPQRGKDWGTKDGTPPARSGIFGLLKALRAHGVTVITYQGTGSSGGGNSALLGALFALLPIFLLGGFLVFRRASCGTPDARRRTPARRRSRPARRPRSATSPASTRSSSELREIVEFLEDQERFDKVGAKMPRGVILHGPPAPARRCWPGPSPARRASRSTPRPARVRREVRRRRRLPRARHVRQGHRPPEGAVVFIDEIDAIGRKRSASGAGNDGEREGTLNQLLVAMDGFTRRPGRRHRRHQPDRHARRRPAAAGPLRPPRPGRRAERAGRMAILLLHARNKPIESTGALERLARVSAGASGATLELMLNEAAIMAARERREVITSADLAEGQLRALAGPQRADAPYSPDERRRIAWHEAGHALAAELCPTHDPTQRVTILARGQAGGLALYGQQDRMLHSPQDLHERCVVTLAGRAAEELHFGGVSSGASNDLEVVNSVVRAAVCELGFSPVVGQLVAPARHGGSAILSEHMRQLVDEEVRRLIDKAYQDALELLHAHLEELAAIANALLSREQLDREDLDELLESLTPRRAPEQAVAQLATARERRRHAA